MGLRIYCSTFWWKHFCWNVIMSGDLQIFTMPVAISNKEELHLGTSGSAVCVSVCQTLTPGTFNNWPVILPCIQNTLGICKHVTFLIPYKVSFMLVTHCKFIYVSIQISESLSLLFVYSLLILHFKYYQFLSWNIN
jgi:hypothetical protein